MLSFIFIPLGWRRTLIEALCCKLYIIHLRQKHKTPSGFAVLEHLESTEEARVAFSYTLSNY